MPTAKFSACAVKGSILVCVARWTLPKFLKTVTTTIVKRIILKKCPKARRQKIQLKIGEFPAFCVEEWLSLWGMPKFLKSAAFEGIDRSGTFTLYQTKIRSFIWVVAGFVGVHVCWADTFKIKFSPPFPINIIRMGGTAGSPVPYRTAHLNFHRFVKYYTLSTSSECRTQP